MIQTPQPDPPQLQDDGRFLILMVTALGAFASIAAIVFELGASNRSAPGLILATVTIALTGFSLHYAHDYYRGGKPGRTASSFRMAIRMRTPTTGISSTSRS